MNPNPNPERKAKTRLLVDRPVDRTYTESSLLSVGRAVDRSMPRSTRLILCMSCTRPAFSTGQPCSRPGAFLACFNALVLLLWFPISLLTFSISSNSYVTTNFTLMKIFQIWAELQQTSIYHLAKSIHELCEIDTRALLERSGRNRHTISAKSTHDLDFSSAISWNAPHMPSLHFTLRELPYMPITKRVSNSATTRPHEELIMSQHWLSNWLALSSLHVFS